MKVGEIPVNSTIQIRVSRGDKKFECMGVVVARRDDGLYLTPLKHNGQTIDFSSDKIQILLFYVNPERQAFGWSGCRIRKDTYQGKLCHLLTTKRDSVRVNRRGEPRIRTELPAIVRSVYDDKEYDIVIRNYSENGLGFVCANRIPEREWTPITVVYEDKLQNLYISMRVNILREMQLPSGLYRYGVNILQPDENWISYVTSKLDKFRSQTQEMSEDEE
ncbi:MAG: PilZ domain-containing protein [Eubacterium sp.]|nr:PilZ domain-containing protein [Eubacterium sp.]